MPSARYSAEEEEALRQKLFDKLQRLADSQENVKAWQAEYDAWVEAAAQAERDGAPPPPEVRAHPAAFPFDPRYAGMMKSEFGIDTSPKKEKN